MTVAYGIDFGTTNCVLARYTGAGVETVIAFIEKHGLLDRG